ncbi:MAG: hypothetical protein A2104_07845 [Candidatus Melainabacteria bacterium GWF2_32_7]|nr:MAG: hypothetical protein A2104_07845 [Candidatus Melainabacteria bacterium GWF2_32_7]
MNIANRKFSKIKSLIKPPIAILLIIHFLLLPVYAASASQKNYKVIPQNTIISLNVNKELNYDYEVYINIDGSFSLPFKNMAKLLDVKTAQDNQTKEISFTSPNGIQGSVDYKNQKIIYGNKSIAFKNQEPTKLVFLAQGLMSDTKDEVFVPIKVLNEILETEINPDERNCSVSIKTNKALKILLEYNEQQNPFNHNPKSDDVVVQPQKKGPLTLDTVDINTQLRLDSTKTTTNNQNHRDNSVNNLSQVGLNGTLLGGVYKIDSDIHNDQSPFSFGGLGFNYNKSIKDNSLELGDITSLKSNELSIGNGLLGASFGNINDNDSNYRNISGQVEQGSKINIYCNDKYYSTLSTIGGYYSLKTLPFSNEKIYKIRLEEVKPSGEIKTIKEKYYSDSSLNPKGQTKYAVIAGVTGQDNKFFGNDISINDSASKKLVSGIKVSHGLTNKLTVSAIGVGDHIISTPAQDNNFLNDPSNSLLFGPYIDSNKISGQTGILSLNYAPTGNFNIASDIGMSKANSSTNDIFSKNPVGHFSTISANYIKSDYGLSGKLFDYSKGFYLAGSSGATSDTTDKAGGEISGNVKLKNTYLSGSLSKYSAGLSNSLISGKYNFNEYNLNSSTLFKDGSNLSFNYDDRAGKSNIGTATSNSYGMNYNKRLTDNLSFYLQGRSDDFKNQYTSSSKDLNNNYSSYKLLNAQLDYDLQKNRGKLNLMHDIVRAGTNGFKGNYNSIRIGYTTPTFKGVSASTFVGYHYAGLNKGFDFSATLGYEFKSGRKFEISYNFNRLLGSFINNIFIPTTSHSSLVFNVFDAISLIAGGISSIGFSNTNYGYIQAIAYLDLNQNGVKEADEPTIPHIPVTLEGFGDNYTNKKGSYSSKGLSEGIYNVKLNLDKLSGLLGLSQGSMSEYKVRVDKREKTRVYFGLISSIGSISGKVSIKDEYNRIIDLKDLVVSILNQNGEEVKYSLIDSNGNYFISGLPPGKYTVKLDKDFIDTYHLKSQDMDKIITIPPSYNDYVDIKDINLDYVQI